MKLHILSLVATLCALPADVMAQPYRLGLITPPSHQWTKTAEQLADEIDTATEGRVEIMVMPSGQLGNEARILQQVQTGAVDFAFLTAAEFANRDADFAVFYAPYLVDNTQAAAELLRGDVAGRLLANLQKFGLHGLGWGMAGMRQIVMAGQVETATDLAGKRIRTVPLAPEMDFWKSVGSAPAPLPLPALYDAFANGQVDGMQIDFEGTWNAGYWRNAGTVIESDHMIFPMLAVASERKWQGISPADRDAITAIVARGLDAMNQSYAQVDADNLSALKGAGVDVMTVDRAWFGDAVDRWYDEWRPKAPMLEVLEAEVKK